MIDSLTRLFQDFPKDREEILEKIIEDVPKYRDEILQKLCLFYTPIENLSTMNNKK